MKRSSKYQEKIEKDESKKVNFRLKALNSKQAEYIKLLNTKDVVMAIGVAGTRLVGLTGKILCGYEVINRILPVKRARQVYYNCICKGCGGVRKINANVLKHSKTVCRVCEPVVRPRKLDTMGNSLVYKRWDSIKQRCFNPKNKDYRRYGGRGVTVYEPWIYDFRAFERWLLDNLGLPPKGMTLDRIDNNGNYEPGNLKWSTALEQQHNRRHEAVYKRKYEHRFGVTFNITELSILTGIRPKIFSHDHARGITSIETILEKAHRLGHIDCWLGDTV